MNDIYDEMIEKYIDGDIHDENIYEYDGNFDHDTFIQNLEIVIGNRMSVDSNDIKDLFRIIRNRYEFLTKQMNFDDTVELADAKNEYDAFVDIIIEKIIEFYKLEYNDDSIVTNMFERDELANVLYHFFIKDFSDNMIMLFHGYLIDNENMILDKFEVSSKVKDVTTISVREKIGKDPVALATVLNMSELIDIAIGEFMSNPSRIIKDIVNYDPDAYYNYKMKEYFKIDNDTDNNDLEAPLLNVGSEFAEVFFSVLDDQDMKLKITSDLINLIMEEFLEM